MANKGANVFIADKKQSVLETSVWKVLLIYSQSYS